MVSSFILLTLLIAIMRENKRYLSPSIFIIYYALPSRYIPQKRKKRF